MPNFPVPVRSSQQISLRLLSVFLIASLFIPTFLIAVPEGAQAKASTAAKMSEPR
jgi:hypothetical protein